MPTQPSLMHKCFLISLAVAFLFIGFVFLPMSLQAGDTDIAPGPELSTEECKDIIDQLAEENVLNISFSGGEALTRPDFFEIAQYARSKRFAVRILTNGTLITTLLADRLAALNPVRVEMSVYGAKAETHDGITLMPGSFKRTMRAFRLLGERGVNTTVKTPLMKENIGEFREIRALADELGTIFRYYVTITPKDDGCRSPLWHRLCDEDLLSLFRQEMAPEKWKRMSLKVDDHVCNMGRNTITIDPYGEVFPCVQVRMAAGDLRRQRLGAIWQESPVLRRMRGITWAQLTGCSDCELREFCVRCAGLALVEDGNLLGPSMVACREARLRWQVVMEKGVI